MSLTVRPLLVTETAAHKDEHIVCPLSFVFSYFPPRCISIVCISLFYFFPPWSDSSLQLDVFHMAGSLKDTAAPHLVKENIAM